MTNYFCSCGEVFVRKVDELIHIAKNKGDLIVHEHCTSFVFDDSSTFTRKERLINWFLNLNIYRIQKIIGYLLLLFVIQNHFKFDFTIVESILLGIGIGLFVDWDRK